MDMDFSELRRRALAVAAPRRLSKSAESGGVGAAILTARGDVYVGACIDMACSIGFCAEHAAAAAMVTAGESVIAKVAAVDATGRPVPPCGRCREFMAQLSDRNGDALVLVGEGAAVPLRELLPLDWRDAF